MVVVLVAVLALFIVGTLGPAVEWLESHRMTRGWAIALVFVSLLSCTVLLMGLTIPSLVEQTTRLAKQEPMMRERLASLVSRSPFGVPLADSLRTAHYEGLSKDATGAAMAYSGRAFEIVAYIMSGVFLALYTMIDRDRLRGGLFAIVPRSHHIRLSRVLLNLETIVGGYIRGQIVTSGLMAIFVFALLTACRIPNAIAIAVFAGIADVLPYVGTFLSVGPATLAALSRGPGIAVLVLLAMLAYEELESRFLVPRVYGRALRLPSSMVLLALPCSRVEPSSASSAHSSRYRSRRPRECSWKSSGSSFQENNSTIQRCASATTVRRPSTSGGRKVFLPCGRRLSQSRFPRSGEGTKAAR
jgi:predicted PurR-regulated permease PerM